MIRTSWIPAAAISLLAISSAWAQQQAVRVHGTVEGVDGSTLTVKPSQGSDIKIRLTADAKVRGVVKASLSEVKPGEFVGVGAMPQADGSQRAIRLTIFPKGSKIREGFRPWSTRPNGTMTNATVDTTVAGVDGQVLTVKYAGGEKKIIVPPSTIILRYEPSDKSELKPGAHISIARASKKPDGSYEAASVNVGRDGVVPR